jgi:hypothetical protein
MKSLATAYDAGNALKEAWGVVRKKPSVELSQLSDATLKDDVEDLKRLIGAGNPATFQYTGDDLPKEILVASRSRLSLLDIAAGCGSERVFSLLHLFFGMNPTWTTFATAIVNGQCSMVRSVWDRLSGKEESFLQLCVSAKSAAEFHRTDILIWLVGQPEALSAQGWRGGSTIENVVKYVAKEAVSSRWVPAIMALSREGVVDFSEIEYRKCAARCSWVAFLDIFLPITLADWIELLPSSYDQRLVVSWLKSHAPSGESDLVDAALVGNLWERSKALRRVLVGRVERGEPINPAWRVVFEREGIVQDLESAAEARAWLTLGLDANKIESCWAPVIIWHAEMRRRDVIATLAAAGADVNMQEDYCQPALIHAAERGWIEEIDTLLACGANVNVRALRSGGTALRIALSNKHDDVAERLLAAGADPLTAFESEEAAEDWRRSYARKRAGEFV